MTPANPKDIAIVIPARNEADRIETCLTALADQNPDRVTVILVVNNTSDATVRIAQAVATRNALDLEILDQTLPAAHGVGLARRMGCDHALHLMPALAYLLTTDADCVVAPNWVSRSTFHLDQVDAVCGKVDLIEAESHVLSGMDSTCATNEGRYRHLVQDFYARHAPDCTSIRGTHGEAAGASLGFRKDAYLAVGGFAPARCGEDRQIIRNTRAAGHKVLHADDVNVRASCRLAGRAEGGMAEALLARITGGDYLIDDCLPKADWLVENATRGTLRPLAASGPGSRPCPRSGHRASDPQDRGFPAARPLRHSLLPCRRLHPSSRQYPHPTFDTNRS